MNSEQNDMQTMTDHAEIRQWVEERGGTPAFGVGSPDEPRIQWPGKTSDDRTLVPAAWSEWFRSFEHGHFKFLCRDRVEHGRVSHEYQILRRGKEEAA